MTDQELKELVASLAVSQAETAVSQAETSEQLKTLRQAQAETSEQLKTLRQAQAETSEQLKTLRQAQAETSEQLKTLRQAQAETSEQLKIMQQSQAKTDEQIKIYRAESAKEMKALRTELGKLGGRLGDFVQEMVRPAAVKLFQRRGLPVHRVLPNMQYRNDDGQTELEIDLFVINGTVGILVECKSHAGIEDVNDHLERLVKFRQYFAEFKDIKLHAAIAAMVMPDEVARYAYKKGLYVMAQNGEAIVIKNDDKFSPKEW